MLVQLKQKLTPYRIHMLASVLFGGNAIAIKLATTRLDPIFLAGLRFFGVGLVIAYLYRVKLSGLNKNALKLIVISSLLVTIYASTHYTGIHLTTALKEGIIKLIMPMVLYVFAIAFLREKAISKVLYGALIGLLGSIIIVGAPIFQAGMVNRGDVLLIFSVFVLAGNMALTKYTYRFASVAQILSVSNIIAGGVMLAFVYAGGREVISGNIDLTTVLATSYLIFIGGVLALLMLYSSLRHLRVEETAPVFYLVPLTTVLIAALALGEELSYLDFIGASVIVFGVMLAHPHHHHVFHKFHLPDEGRLHKILNFVRKHLGIS